MEEQTERLYEGGWTCLDNTNGFLDDDNGWSVGSCLVCSLACLGFIMCLSRECGMSNSFLQILFQLKPNVCKCFTIVPLLLFLNSQHDLGAKN